MESPAPISGRRSGTSTTAPAAYAAAAEISFDDDDEEIHSLIHPPTATGNNSFTALLGLPANQALQLLHHPSATAAADMWRLPHVPLSCSPTFPSNPALVERAAQYSVFAAAAAGEDSAASSSGSGNSRNPKAEPAETTGQTTSLDAGAAADHRPKRAVKRKEAQKSDKGKGAAKKGRNAEENTGGDDEKLPYVHVRARRGQATNSHSLAERARREKIDARMKLLQELVPGCSKISGTAPVLDEIINHVQCLQRQVEFLSMRLAAVNPRVDFSGLDNFLLAECGRVMASGNNPWPSLDFTVNGHQWIWHVDSSLPFVPITTSSTPAQCSSPKTSSLTRN